MLVTTAIIVFLVGCKVVSIGMHGRAIDDHPVCARCKFDLFGKSPNSQICPECGKPLHGPNAVQNGNRVRRPAVLATGIAMILVGGLSCLWMLAAIHQTNFSRFIPDWLLIREAKAEISPQSARWGGVRSDSTHELALRVLAGSISASDRATIVAIALAAQADHTKRWNPEWGDMIEYFQSKGQLSAKDWATYLAQDEFATLTVRPNCAVGDPIAYVVDGDFRGGTRLASPRTRPSWPAVSATVSGLVGTAGWGSNSGPGMISLRGTVELPATAWAKLRAGPQTLTVSFGGFAGYFEKTPTLFGPMTVTSNWNLLPPGQPSVQLYQDENLAEQIQSRLKIKAINCATDDLVIDITCENPPSQMFFDAFIRSQGKEWKGSNPLEIRPGPFPGGVVYFQNTNGLSAAAVKFDLILRPSFQGASWTTDINKMLDHEFVFHNLTALPK